MTMPRQYAHLVRSKWTSTAPLLGWRQFHVVALRRAASGWEAELAASVEPTRRVWVALRELRNRARFAPGWSTLAALRAASPAGERVACGGDDGDRRASTADAVAGQDHGDALDDEPREQYNPAGMSEGDLDTDQARAILSKLSDTLCEELTAIADDEDDGTTLERAAAVLGRSTPEVTALVVLGLLASLREYEDRFTVYESLIAKVGRTAATEGDA